jgi:L-amino acid N-acyltransferase YncA
MTHADWPAVEAIYAEGIAAPQATFETTPPSSSSGEGVRPHGSDPT